MFWSSSDVADWPSAPGTQFSDPRIEIVWWKRSDPKVMRQVRKRVRLAFLHFTCREEVGQKPPESQAAVRPSVTSREALEPKPLQLIIIPKICRAHNKPCAL